MMQNHYYKVLGVVPGCSMTEIKKAYRLKAKEFHPDLNHEAGAQEKFIEVNEAYEFFLSQSARVKETITDRGFSTAEMQKVYEEWIRRERMKARARAAQAAKKKFEEFRNSPLYRTSNILSMGVDYVSIFVGTFVILGSLFGVYYRSQIDGFISSNGLFAAFTAMIFGLIIILFSASDIKRRRNM